LKQISEMRKRIISRTPHSPVPERKRLDLERIASVEMTSEDETFPIEAALVGRGQGGWRAAEPGIETIRLIFDEPQKLRRVSIVFEETETKRTQEFTLRWSPDWGRSFREIVRQLHLLCHARPVPVELPLSRTNVQNRSHRTGTLHL
jgi:hypothetical protein